MWVVFQASVGTAEPWGPLDWLTAVAMVPLATAGFAMIAAAVYLGVPLFNPRVALEVYPSRSEPGDPLEIAWRLDGPLESVKAMSVVLEGREEVIVPAPGGTRTRARVFRRHLVLRTTDPTVMRYGGVAYTLPETLIPSFSGRRYRIAWYFRVFAGVGRWPQVRQEIEYPVLAPKEAPESMET